MAHASELPCDGDGVCMLCKKTPPEEEMLLCKTCVTPWHVSCLTHPPESMSSVLQWECPDCSPVSPNTGNATQASSSVNTNVVAGGNADLIAAIRAIEADKSLTDPEKAKKRQELMSGGVVSEDDTENGKQNGNKDFLDVLGGTFSCSFCMQLPERPVTTPCGHNFCLKCFQKWVGQGKRTCAKCRAVIPSKMASQPRINSALVVAIRMARAAKSTSSAMPDKVYHFMHNQDRPDKAFTTERAKKPGKANACSGKIFVTVAPDHFGPILAENDPERNQGVLVGELWEDRMECRQWGAHLPHVAGIAGQADYGAQSVALSGGYEDDEDHGEWFLYTGSGGRDLSGNKRTNKEQSFDQKFEKLNEALRVSCKKGYPVRVVRSHKEKRSAYAPESGVRYDGIYRIEKCWRKIGIQGFKVCRYLFVRCDNEPAPWTSDEHGDHPRPLPVIKELKKATDVIERKETPAWDYNEEHGWRWTRSPPTSRKAVQSANPEDRKRARKAIRQAQNLSVRERLLKEFCCHLCRKVMTHPLTTPCAHNFCKLCLEGAFAGQKFVRERTREGGRTLRAQKNVMKCPSCPTDISDFLQNPQVNRELMNLIESLQRQNKDENGESSEGAPDGSEDSKPDLEDASNELGPEGRDMFEVGDKDLRTPQKRKKTENGSCIVKESTSSDEVLEAGNDSPSSPLHVRSDTDDS
ncbi:E3 ubiquitin-protein ligase ORTHRUS 2-like [Aristolochia californica]|uniref:E3 ubiquitin-protein ligase ORTHRUS 2-like n=1 Tax=Aristolochia californica TaxID=171875 RepID=UPI0035DDDBCB